jgi:hypothetical protein
VCNDVLSAQGQLTNISGLHTEVRDMELVANGYNWFTQTADDPIEANKRPVPTASLISVLNGP